MKKRNTIFLSNMMFGTTRGGFWLPFVFLMSVQLAVAQVNIAGKKGLMLIPTAEATADGTFTLSALTIPPPYSFVQQNQLYGNVIYVAGLTVLPRLDIQFQFINVYATNNAPKIPFGLGDRQLDFRYLLVKETKKRPSVAVAATFPFSKFAPTSSTTLVATKTWWADKDFQVQLSAGYGLPVYFFRDESNLNNYNFTTLMRVGKKNPDTDYLVGEFGGVKLSYRQKVGVMGEWDGQKVNVGAYAVIGQRLTLQTALLAGKKLGWGVTYQTPLRRE
ncbi:MAG: YjbH domain-containing protein [Spirosomataceae bacterium]